MSTSRKGVEVFLFFSFFGTSSNERYPLCTEKLGAVREERQMIMRYLHEFDNGDDFAGAQKMLQSKSGFYRVNLTTLFLSLTLPCAVTESLSPVTVTKGRGRKKVSKLQSQSQ
jgi:hypothetical protein